MPQLCISGATVYVCRLEFTLILLTYKHSQLINSHHPPPAVPHPAPLPSGGPAFVTWVIVTLSNSLSSAERGWNRAGQTSGWARLLLPGLSAWRPLLPPLLRAPGWLPPLAILLPRRASHLSDCHAVQLVDRTYAGQDLRSTARDFNCHYRHKLCFDIYFPTTCENKADNCQHLLVKRKVSPVGFSQTKWHLKGFDFCFK